MIVMNTTLRSVRSRLCEGGVRPRFSPFTVSAVWVLRSGWLALLADAGVDVCGMGAAALLVVVAGCSLASTSSASTM